MTLSWRSYRDCPPSLQALAWPHLPSPPPHEAAPGPRRLLLPHHGTTSLDRYPMSSRYFTNATGWGEPLIYPSLSFVPGYANIDILDCCNGLLLCHNRTVAGAVCYVVCNPATEQWAAPALPDSVQAGNIFTARLVFDPALSPHFHVFEFVETDPDPEGGYVFVDGLEIYSSKTGEWIYRDSRWSDEATLCFDHDLSTVFLSGFLHVFAAERQDVLAVDIEGNTWRTIAVPHGNDDGFIGQSQGRLYYLNMLQEHDFKVTVFVLEDYSSGEWVFKHSVMASELFGMSSFDPIQYYRVIAFHLECHLVYLICFGF
ncbi:unnamed protein product [Urochloa decumbens]|uniref:F-box protein At3g26010-like beta-propeller domain-containing protein n=1 Tax=Urochloa decumbens TaxID=240449 RepID=A0ABC8WXG3_9POAL